jgi:chorismate-pyruvate lyase
MERSHVEYARFQPQHTLYQQATAHLKQPPKVLWGRRILYRIDGNPLLVHELFLPEFNQ